MTASIWQSFFLMLTHFGLQQSIIVNPEIARNTNIPMPSFRAQLKIPTGYFCLSTNRLMSSRFSLSFTKEKSSSSFSSFCMEVTPLV